MKLDTFKCNKPPHYIKLYEELFTTTPKRLLEIGVQTGRSLRMWANAFPEAEIVGLDVKSAWETIPERNVRVVLGHQTDEELLKTLGDFDIIVDDGSHITSHQQKSFDILFPKLNNGGFYVIEDLEPTRTEEFQDTTLTTTEYLVQKGLKTISADNLIVVEKV